MGAPLEIRESIAARARQFPIICTSTGEDQYARRSHQRSSMPEFMHPSALPFAGCVRDKRVAAERRSGISPASSFRTAAATGMRQVLKTAAESSRRSGAPAFGGNSSIQVMIGDERFEARLEDALAPSTCARFRSLLPCSQRLVHARSIGDACWIGVRGLELGVGLENATCDPQPGQFIYYPGAEGEAVILLAYGSVSFPGNRSHFAGNAFLTIVGGLDRLGRLGREVAGRGCRFVTFGSR